MTIIRDIATTDAFLPAEPADLFAGHEGLFDNTIEALEPQPDDALIFWANKRPVVMPKGRGHANVSPEYSGFLVPTDQNPLLDEAMDRFGYQPITIQHSDDSREHWRLDTAHLFVVAQGLQSQAQMRATTERYGVAYGWGTERDRSTGEVKIDPKTGKPKLQSTLRLRCFVTDLLMAGYLEPLKFSISGTMTGDILQGLTRQFAVLRTVKQLREAHNLPPVKLPFWAYSLTFEPGHQTKRGQATVVPPTVHLPATIDGAYLKEHRIAPEWVALVESILDETVAWSVTESERITAVESDSAANGCVAGQLSEEEAAHYAAQFDSAGDATPF